MKITAITAEPLRVPLKKPFVTALRSASSIDNVLITIRTDEPEVSGFGEAAAIPAVTGETAAGIRAAVLNHIAPGLLNRPATDLRTLTKTVDGALRGNTSAKAGVETALYSLFAKSLGVPLYRLLGGNADAVPENDITISAADAAGMIQSCVEAVDDGFRHIKIKLGKTPETDFETLVKINAAVNGEGLPRGAARVFFRVDGNCGWSAKEAIRLIRRWEDAGVPVEWVEQPVPAWDIFGLTSVTQNTDTPIMADEACFGERDAIKLLEARAVDWINVKLAKTGGIGHALAVAEICRAYNVPCMMGCMLESRLGTTAAVHAAATGLFKAVDLDGPLLCEAPSAGNEPEYREDLAEFSGRFIHF